MGNFTVQVIIGGHRSIVCRVICKTMVVFLIVSKQRMLISDVFMENAFVNSGNVTQCNKKGPFSFVRKHSSGS